MSKPRRVMYEATVRMLPFEDQCRVAALAGCEALTMTPTTYLGLLGNSTSTRDIKLIAADHGISISHFDPIARWTPKWEPSNYRGAFDFAQLAFDTEDFLRMAAALECQSVTAMGTHPSGAMSHEEIVDHFGALCERAAREGIRVDLEFIPFFGVATLEEAWSIVRDAGAPNSGLVLDIWHYRRAGTCDDLLKSIPGERITIVQLNDGEMPLPAHVSLIEDCLARRQAPGKGDFEVARVLDILRATGGLNNPGPEIFNSAMAGRSPEEIAAICNESLAPLGV